MAISSFDVLDEDGCVINSFDELTDALACGKAAPWYRGQIKLRRDGVLSAHQFEEGKAARRQNWIDLGFC